MSIESKDDLSSDHSPVILNVSCRILLVEVTQKLSTKRTDWEIYQKTITAEINVKMPLKCREDIEEAVEELNRFIHIAADKSTPPRNVWVPKEHVYPSFVIDKIHERRQLRKTWHMTGCPKDKAAFNKASQGLKKLTEYMVNDNLQSYLTSLTPTCDTNYSLWKATSNLKRPKTQRTPIKTKQGTWARSDQDKAKAFAEHLYEVFQPYPFNNQEIDDNVKKTLCAATQMCLPLKNITPKEVLKAIHELHDNKSPGYDLISATLLKHLPKKGITLIVAIFNACLRLSIFPSQWKIAQVIMILKPGKTPHEVSSYRPISLLPLMGKLFEKMILTRIRIHLEDILPKHQFGFREGHGTIEQVHRIIEIINSSFENKKYCSAVFLDIAKAFDKVWHEGLLFKIKRSLPHSFFQIIKSYLEKRCFEVKYNAATSSMYEIKSGVPQGSILGPVLYLIFTADLPTSKHTTTATYADDTALLAVHDDPDSATRLLQTHLTLVEEWLKKWRIKANKDKSVQVTFTLRKRTCPQLFLYNEKIPQAEEAKYLGMHLDRRLTWRKHIWTKRKQLDHKLRSMYWLIGHKSQLTINNKLLVYKTIIKPIWTYGIQLWGTASHSNIEILERFQSKTIRSMLQIPLYISNEYINSDLGIRTVKQEIEHYSKKYQIRLDRHRNELAAQLQGTGSLQFCRLKRKGIPELVERFTAKV